MFSPAFNPNDPLNLVDENIIIEMVNNEPTKAYLTLKTKIAQIDERLNAGNGWFWKTPLTTPTERTQLKALRETYMVALGQVVDTLNSMSENKHTRFTMGI